MASDKPEILWRPDPGQSLSVLFDVFALGQRVRALLTAAMAGTGLRPDEYAAYSVVFETGSVTMTELARQLGLPVTTAADYVRAMRERDHVRRLPRPGDNRAYLLSLTPAGLRAHRKASEAFTRAHAAFAASLAPVTEAAARDTLARQSGAAEQAAQELARPTATASRRTASASAAGPSIEKESRSRSSPRPSTKNRAPSR